MKVSLENIKFYNDMYKCSGDPAPDGIEALVEKINTQLGGVDEVIDFGAKYKDILIVKIVSCEKHPNADKLNVCKIDDGGVNKNVERDSNGYVQVVCGAPNARVDLITVWIPPSVVVPSTYGKDPLELEAREIRGQVSNGMLASPSELAISGDHNGIVEVDQHAEPGQTISDAFKLDDYIIDIENKMFTHRPDLFGMMGVAREIAGIQGQNYKSPDWYLTPLPIDQASELPLTVENQIPELAPRFMAVAMSGIEVKPSPLWLQINLTRVGIKPINNIVDITNYFMMLTAQPLHAYDYDKVKALSGGEPNLIIRTPKEGEKIKLLGGKVIEPKSTDIMIATDKQLIGIGGVMGGADTEIDANTKNIILECANFDMYTTRRTSMAHGLFTDASTRFTKGQSPQQCPSVFAKVVDDIKRLTTGKVASQVIDVHDKLNRPKSVTITDVAINRILGSKFDKDLICQLLENTEFEIKIGKTSYNRIDKSTVDPDIGIQPDLEDPNFDYLGTDIEVTAPFWRTDIEILEDVAEEVGRLYGFNKLPKALPNRTTSPPVINKNIVLKEKLRDVLFNLGANEVMTYNFVHGDLLTKVGQKPEESYKLRNALSPDLQYYRQSLTPSSLDKVHSNIKAGYDKFAIFEIGKSHIKGREEDNLPIEFERLAFVFSADPKAAKTIKGAPYYQAKKYLGELFDRLGVKDIRFEEIVLDGKDTNKVYYQKGRSATVYSGEHLIGRIGEYTPAVMKAFKLPDFSAGFELGIKPLANVVSAVSIYKPLNRYPSTDQDITIAVASDTKFSEVEKRVIDVLSNTDYNYEISPVSIYSPDDSKEKHVTFNITLSHPDRTLKTDEVNGLLKTLVD